MDSKNFIFRYFLPVFIVMLFIGSIALAQSTTLSIEMYHDDVIQLKIDLEKAGFKVSDNPTTYFGPKTDEMVRAFQEAHGLTPNGVVGPETWEALHPTVSVQETTLLLQNGVRHPSVIQLKIDLDKAGFPVPGNTTDFFGPLTEESVKAFQRAHNLSVDGIARESTLRKLEDVITALAASPLLQNGVRHPSVIDLKVKLDKVGFTVPGNMTEFFGPLTEESVKAFQRAYNLAVDGIAGTLTLRKLDEVVLALETQPLLQNGVRHPAVIQLKIDLDKVGFTVPGNTTDFFGPLTEESVKAFQKAHNLSIDGVAGPATLRKLQEVIANPPPPVVLQNGVTHPNVVPLKVSLGKVGFPVPGNTTEFFGPKTEEMVRAFQRAYGLSVNGIANSATLSKLQEVVASGNSSVPLLRLGVSHLAVVQLKQDLAKAGFKVSDFPNNVFDSKTEEMVRAFQRAQSLTVDGIAGPQTLSRLRQVITNPTPAPAPTVLQNGVTHPNVVPLKVNLGKVGFPVPGNTTEFFGPKTEEMVRAFQRAYGLSVNGIANATTLTKLSEIVASGNSPAPTSLRLGVTHLAVVQLKLDLAKAGFKVSDFPNNVFDSKTDEMVRAFQRSQGLSVDGIAGPRTQERLRIVVNGALVGRTFVIDAGHGGSDPGAVNGNLRESDVVLDISLRLETLLRNAGATVIMTRNTDVFLSLTQRVDIANASKADAFISIHANAGGGTGTETYWNSRHSSTNSRTLATNVQRELVSSIKLRDRGVKEGNFSVIRSTTIPSILVEVAFMDHPDDRAKLASSSFRQQSAQGIFNGIIANYK